MQAASFSPTELTVAKGTTVGFQNQSSVVHNIVFDAPQPDGTPADIGNINSPATVTRLFGTSGTFNLHCTIHPGMTAKVIVT
jgi:plastocyanin